MPVFTRCLKLSALAACLVSAAWAQDTMDLNQVRERARQIQSRMFGPRRCQTPWWECIAPEVQSLRALLRDYTVWRLNRSGGDTDELVNDLSTVDDVFGVEIRRKELGPKNLKGLPPQVLRQAVTGGELIVIKHLFETEQLAMPASLALIQGFRRLGSNEYVFADDTGDAMSGVMWPGIGKIESPVRGELWFIAGGQVGGFMGDLDREGIYSFDGFHFKQQWKPEDREDMQVTIDDDRIHLTYLGPKIERAIGFPSQHWMEERLEISSSGVFRTLLIDHGEGSPPIGPPPHEPGKKQ